MLKCTKSTHGSVTFKTVHAGNLNRVPIVLTQENNQGREGAAASPNLDPIAIPCGGSSSHARGDTVLGQQVF